MLYAYMLCGKKEDTTNQERQDVLVKERYLSARDVEALLLGLRKEGALVLRKLGVVDEGIGGVVVFAGMIPL